MINVEALTDPGAPNTLVVLATVLAAVALILGTTAALYRKNKHPGHKHLFRAAVAIITIAAISWGTDAMLHSKGREASAATRHQAAVEAEQILTQAILDRYEVQAAALDTDQINLNPQTLASTVMKYIDVNPAAAAKVHVVDMAGNVLEYGYIYNTRTDTGLLVRQSSWSSTKDLPGDLDRLTKRTTPKKASD